MAEASARIKVCGITRLEDAQLAVDLGAFAIGFIFYEKSPRYISPEAAGEIIRRLKAPASLLKVGVFVNADIERLLECRRVAGIDILQLHGDEDADFVRQLPNERIWKAIRLKSEDQLIELSRYPVQVEAFLFDAAVSGAYGGTGHRIAGELLAKIPRDRNVLIAGGLTPDNWREVYDRFRPFGIDLSSGVESRPGVKDADKLKVLFEQRG